MGIGTVGAILGLVVALALLSPMLLARRRAPQERGHTPRIEEFCAGTFAHFGRTNIPMFRLSVYHNFLVIALLAPTVIPFAQLTRVEVQRGFFGRRLRIETTRGDAYHSP